MRWLQNSLYIIFVLFLYKAVHVHFGYPTSSSAFYAYMCMFNTTQEQKTDIAETKSLTLSPLASFCSKQPFPSPPPHPTCHITAKETWEKRYLQLGVMCNMSWRPSQHPEAMNFFSQLCVVWSKISLCLPCHFSQSVELFDLKPVSCYQESFSLFPFLSLVPNSVTFVHSLSFTHIHSNRDGSSSSFVLSPCL